MILDPMSRAPSGGPKPSSIARPAVSAGERRTRAVLVGAGHAHLYALKRARSFAERGHELVLIAPGRFWYSGLATGMLGGAYPPELDQIDAGALAVRGGGRFIEDHVVGIEPASRTLRLGTGEPITYDAVSLNLGSETRPVAGEADRPDRCFSVKPIHRLRDLRAALTERFAAGAAPRVVIAGGGATAFELAGNVLALAERAGARALVTVLAGGKEILAQLPRAAAAAVQANLAGRGARVIAGARVARVTDAGVATEAGAEHPYDLFVNATGLAPRSLAGAAGLPALPDGAMIVNEHLRSVADARIHGGGDCIAFGERRLAKVGVYAIREAPVLHRNLLACLDGSGPEPFIPQRSYLWIMNLGDGTGLAARGRLWWHGRSAFRLKDWIDRRFLRDYAS